MTDRELTIPVASDPVESRLAQMERWLEGYVDSDGVRHPGLIDMVGELHGELKLRRERREAIARGLATGGVLAIAGFILTWLKDHIKV